MHDSIEFDISRSSYIFDTVEEFSKEYKNIISQNLSYLITNRDNNSPAIFYETMLSKFALSQGVSEDKVDDWKKQLNKSEKVGNFGFTSFPVLTAAYLG